MKLVSDFLDVLHHGLHYAFMLRVRVQNVAASKGEDADAPPPTIYLGSTWNGIEFWGEELKPGSKVSYNAGQGYVIHLSQAALGETKKGSENVVVYVEVDDKKSVIGTLCVEKHPQIMCDLIFEKDFELSHSSKTTSVFLCGYRLPIPIIGSDSGEDEISSNEELETDEILMKNDEIKAFVMDGKKDEQDVDDDSTDDSA